MSDTETTDQAWLDEPDEVARRKALDALASYLDGPPITRILQRGRDPQTAEFRITFDDGAHGSLGIGDVLFSQSKLRRVLAIRFGVALPIVKADKWAEAIAGLIRYGITVDEDTDGSSTAILADRLAIYAAKARNGTEHDQAVSRREPYKHDTELWLSADHLAKWIRTNIGDQVTIYDVRSALSDLGFRTAKVSYTVRGSGKMRKRSSASYYHAPLDLIERDE